MIYSMTGYGRGVAQSEEYILTVEMKSVNNRYMDIFVRIPRTIVSLEEPLKAQIKKKLSRGKLDVFVGLEFKEGIRKNLVLNSKLLEEYRNIHEQINENYGLTSSLRAMDLMKFPDVISASDMELKEDTLALLTKQATEQALNAILDMRRTEGEHLKEDVCQRCELLQQHIAYIEENSQALEEEYRQHLREKLDTILEKSGYKADEQRIVQEAAILADKSCITEELVRFKSHINQLLHSFNTEEPVGRKLDFVLQEMNREVNTMGSKSDRLDIVDRVVILKSELEKIREQIQNIE